MLFLPIFYQLRTADVPAPMTDFFLFWNLPPATFLLLSDNQLFFVVFFRAEALKATDSQDYEKFSKYSFREQHFVTDGFIKFTISVMAVRVQACLISTRLNKGKVV